MQTMTVTAFKAKALQMIAQVATNKEPLVLTRHGRPVASIIPWADQTRETSFGNLAGSVLHEGDLVCPATEDDEWEASQ